MNVNVECGSRIEKKSLKLTDVQNFKAGDNDKINYLNTSSGYIEPNSEKIPTSPTNTRMHKMQFSASQQTSSRRTTLCQWGKAIIATNQMQ